MADNKNTLLKYIVIILVILMINIFGGYFIARKILDYTYSTEEFTSSESEDEKEGDEFGDVSGPPGQMINLDAINLNPSQSTGEIFSCDIVLEARDPEVVAELETRNVQIMDRLSGYLALKTVQELGDAGKWDQYRREMAELVNSLLTKGKISNLYIKQKIIQFE